MTTSFDQTDITPPPTAFVPEGALLRKPGLGQSNRVVTYHSDTENDAEFREMSEWSRAEVLIRARKILAAHLGWFDDTGHPTQADSALITDEVTGRIYVVLANEAETIGVFRFLSHRNRLKRLKRWTEFVAAPSPRSVLIVGENMNSDAA